MEDQEDFIKSELEERQPWHQINTTAGAYCIACGRGISIGESAWWNHETIDVACEPDGKQLHDEAQEEIMEEILMEILL